MIFNFQEMTNSKKISWLNHHIRCGGEETYSGFLEALRDTKQGHIVEEVLGLQQEPCQSSTNNGAEQSKYGSSKSYLIIIL